MGIKEEIKEFVIENIDNAADFIVELFGDLSELLQEGANKFLSEMIEFVMYTPLVADNEIITSLWETIRIISFSIIGVMFAWEGFKKVISSDNVIKHIEFKEMLVRMVYGLILAVFSLDIIDIMINFNNALVDTVKSAFPMTLEQELDINNSFSFIMVICLVVVQMVLGVKLILQYWMRIAEIWLMAVLGPLMYTLWINPRWGNYLGQWVNRLVTTIFTTFVWALILALYSGMVSMISTAGMITGFEVLGPVAGICLSVAMLMVMIQTPSFLKQFLDNQPSALHLLKSTYNNVKGSIPTNLATKATGWVLKK